MSLRKDRASGVGRSCRGERRGLGEHPPFHRVLVANRGEIAVRIIRTCRQLGIETVAVYSDADREAPHVRAATEAVGIGAAPAIDSYLRVERIVDAALLSRAEAVHPGYGFLSEQADFGAAVEAAGLVFIGPTPETLATLGDKLAARRSARRAGVPIVPGMLEPLASARPDAPTSAELLEEAAATVGYPLLIKAAAGGGGRGMRRVDSPADLPGAIDGATREAEQAFGDGSIYLERLVEGGRHIEVQLLGDGHGDIVALGERDCSTQRRHQKLVEEAPAPGLDRAEREALAAMAVAVARDVGLRSAATAEFLRAPDGAVYFLEVNARLQVEHGVTELVTGLDLVAEQLSIAAGLPFSEAVRAAAERILAPVGHAIELRISAEDPGREFLPVPGLLTHWQPPAGSGIRVDSGVEAGWRIPPDYDPLLAKVLVAADDREAAIALARGAIARFDVGGVQTTLPFHAWLLDHAPFRGGALRTDLVDRDWQPDGIRAGSARRAAEAVAAHVWSDPETAAVAVRLGGWPQEAISRDDPASAWRSAGRRVATDRGP
jgi:acetyl/propionyl-CoA carboxylase alpha subunit